MLDRRVSLNVRLAVTAAGVAAAFVLLTAVPEGQQQRGKATPGGVIAPQVPTVSAPRINPPTVGVPDARQSSPIGVVADSLAQKVTWVNAAQMEGVVRASQLGLNYVPGEVLVKFRDGVDTGGQSRVLQTTGSTQTPDTLEWAGGFAIVRDKAQPNSYALAEQLKALPEVEFAEPNFIAYIDPIERPAIATPQPLPSQPLLRPNRGSNASVPTGVPTDADYAAYQWNFHLINMPGAWDIQAGGSHDIIVAVIDSGITATTGTMVYPVWTGSSFQTLSMPYAPNPDLPVSRLVSDKDYIGPLVPGRPHVETDGHATHVSGTIGEATNNSLLVSGMAYNVRIMPVKVCSSFWDRMIFRAQNGITGFDPNSNTSCTFANIAAGIDYAVANGARVMNISLGGESQSTTIQTALINAAAQGAFISISMGNDFEDGNATSYPAAYAASIDGVMSVASVGFNSAKAWYSSTGAHCEIAAPGGDNRSGAGRVDRGLVWQSTLLGTDLTGLMPRFDRYDKQPYQGTSMAAPHVAGLAALLMSQMPTLTGAQVERIIRATATDLGTTGKDNSFGHGLIQPRRALFGYGISR